MMPLRCPRSLGVLGLLMVQHTRCGDTQRFAHPRVHVDPTIKMHVVFCNFTLVTPAIQCSIQAAEDRCDLQPLNPIPGCQSRPQPCCLHRWRARLHDRANYHECLHSSYVGVQAAAVLAAIT